MDASRPGRKNQSLVGESKIGYYMPMAEVKLTLLKFGDRQKQRVYEVLKPGEMVTWDEFRDLKEVIVKDSQELARISLLGRTYILELVAGAAVTVRK